LSEVKLAKQLGVSRVPVREALIRLEELQLVRKNLRGREVVRISTRDFEELFEIKVFIEMCAAEKGCQNPLPLLLKRLNRLIERMEECLHPLDTQKLRRINHQFHNLLVESGRNRKLYEWYLNVVKQIRWTSHVSLAQTGRPEISNQEHREICKAFGEGDSARVKTLIQEHNEGLRSRVITALREGEKSISVAVGSG
jgi:DNA-binding GntR family transcriptional regulator